MQNETAGWKKYWDAETSTPFAIQDDRVISYDDEQSISEKVRFAMKEKLGGTMVWSIDTDDFHGDCSRNSSSNDKRFNDNFPLLRSINEAIVQTLKDMKEDEENVIPDEDHRDIKKNSGSSLGGNVLLVNVFAILFMY